MLRTRVITALVLLGLLGGILFLAPHSVAVVAFAIVAALAGWEWAGLMRVDGPGRAMYAGLVLMFCWQAHMAGDAALLFFATTASAFWLLLALPWLRFRWSLLGRDFLGYALGLLLIVSTWVALVTLHGRGPGLLVAVMAVAWVADSAAYFTGRAWGRHKLAPAISPGKTWEGVAGGVAGVLVYGAGVAAANGLLAHASSIEIILGLVLLLLLTALGIVGDLFESLLKRTAGVKDSSGLLPGHGGILDRIDSLMAILPLAALVLYWSGK